MPNQIPPGPKDCWCPFWRKRMSEVCHTCPLWVQVKGKDPQSKAEFDEWSCSFRWMPEMLMGIHQAQHQTSASTDKVATEVNEFHKRMAQQNAQTRQLIESTGNGGP